MPDPEDPDQTPFVADAIISNPVSYGHIHCAEALGIPLHIMFPQPWYPTKSFPHPLSNMSFERTWSKRSRLSYRMVDEFMWIGLGYMINEFRSKVLHLPEIGIGEGGESILVNLNVPISHMWSPSFVPKCVDWPSHVDVVGDFTRIKNDSIPQNTYVPDPRLVEFLNSCGDDKPIYIGFGSMVIADSAKLVQIIKDAANATGYPVILQSGWTKYAEDYEFIANRVMVVGAMPHDWLFQQVSAVIHHGGAGTTSAGLRASNPTFICPFFGDQHFWAEMVYRAGAGPRGCPIANLTSNTLTNSFRVLKSEEIKQNVLKLSEKMNAENGVLNGVTSFINNLPVQDMLCEISLFRKQGKLASVYCETCGLKMCREVDNFIHRIEGGRDKHIRVEYRPKKWGTTPPSIFNNIGFAFSHLVGRPNNDLVARPLSGGGVVIDKVSNNHTNTEHDVDELPENSTRNTRSRSTFTFSQPIDLEVPENHVERIISDNLTPEQNEIEKALFDAKKFQDFFSVLDRSGDNLISVQELSTLMPAEEAQALFHIADMNSDGLLSFAELASSMLTTARR
eukprot:CAMPEP_0174818744 /NCGR_PEP_ID=MMETSP1107-20130205/1596_1 /TAXON_ID=36770 /ORGANISM="Paraphysomonas vestita, Strain GFlagA" /LENGTH=563 /DNA_ID=CAMNT_0016031063 /DNA_START=2103 /DNA_END=3794 /DNA_ORIENTATION=+